MKRSDIIEAIGNGYVRVDGQLVRGESVSYVRDTIRGKGIVAGPLFRFEQRVEDLGFQVVRGHAGKNTKKGWTHCCPARCIILEEE